MLATIRKRVRGDINNSHDQRSLTKFKRAAAEVPCKDWAHGLILSLHSAIFAGSRTYSPNGDAGALACTMSGRSTSIVGAKISSVDAISSISRVRDLRHAGVQFPRAGRGRSFSQAPHFP